jgi:arylsulfatase
MLFDLKADINESNNVANKHPGVVERFLKQAQQIRQELGDINVPAQGQREAGWNGAPKFLRMGRR